jgi:hypothetical protein
MEKEFRMMEAWEIRNRLRNFVGILYEDRAEGGYHLTTNAHGRDLAIVFVLEGDEPPYTAQVVTQMHQKTDYEDSDRYERVVR